jgi:predicted ATPase/DNA-binding CsgD family transcriptional regulator
LPGQHTSFLGREPELASIRTMLRDPAVQLVTLTGPGGVGKTRLAERIATEDAAGRGLEVYWISLAPLETTDQMAQAVAQQFGLKGTGPSSLPDRLASTLLGRPVLIVLDNYEHLFSAAFMAAELLEACPTLTVLATSRGPLNISWEREVSIDPFPLPPANATQTEIESNPAVRLFLDRVPSTSAQPQASLEELQTVGAICRVLDGLPLAIELAAPWRRLLTAAELLARLDHPLPMLVGGPADFPTRLQSMSSAIGWSYALLDRDARWLFRQLSIFPEAFSVEAVEFLAAALQNQSAEDDPGDRPPIGASTLSALASLVNHGVLRAPDEFGFHMLQTIREFGRDLLTEYRELERCGWAHLAWCVSRTAEPVFDPLDGYLWAPTDRAGDQADLSAALAFALDRGSFDVALRLAVGLAPVWAEQGRYGEARAALDRIQAGLPESSAEIRMVVLGWIAEWAWLQGDYASTRNLAQASLEAAERLDHPRAIAANQYRLGRVATLTDPSAAVPLLRDALQLYQLLDEDRNSGWCLVGLGHAALGIGDAERARQWFDEATEHLAQVGEDAGGWLTLAHMLGFARLALHTGELARASAVLFEALAVCRAERNHYFQCLVLAYLCDVHRREKSFVRAVEAAREGLQIAQQLGHRYREWQCLVQLARTALDAKKVDQAALLDGSAAAVRAQLDFADQGEPPVGTALTTTPAQAKRLAELEAAGRKLTGSERLAQVIALELELKEVSQRSGDLSHREREVLRFLAEGATNGEIAERLFVSRRTVDTHVGSILRKLQVASRHEAVESARRQGIVEPGLGWH